MSVEVSGVDRAIARLERLKVGIPAATAKSTLFAAAIILAESQALAPKRTGALASSGFIDSPVRNEDDGYSVTVGFAGPSYVRVVHYNQHLHHLTGRPYFLIDPERRNRRLFEDETKLAIDAEIAR